MFPATVDPHKCYFLKFWNLEFKQIGKKMKFYIVATWKWKFINILELASHWVKCTEIEDSVTLVQHILTDIVKQITKVHGPLVSLFYLWYCMFSSNQMAWYGPIEHATICESRYGGCVFSSKAICWFNLQHKIRMATTFYTHTMSLAL